MFLAEESPLPARGLRISHRGKIQGMGWMVLAALLCSPVIGQAAEGQSSSKESASQGAVVQADELPAATTKTAKPQLTPLQKRKMIVVTTTLIAGIVALVLVLLLWILWWSRRTHRLLREPLPAVTRGDELWYLKGKKGPAPTGERPASDAPPSPPQS